jgi:transketolase
MVVLAPADPIETELAVRAAVAYKGPCYIRLGKAGEPVVHKTRPEFAIGKGIFVRRGQPDAPAIISTGGMLGTTIAAADVLQLRGIKPSVVSMPTVKPLDREMIDELAATCRAIITVEEHGVGGLGSAVAEMIIECARRPRFHAVRLEGLPPNYVGTQEVLRSQRGLSADAIVGVVERLCAQDSARAAAT